MNLNHQDLSQSPYFIKKKDIKSASNKAALSYDLFSQLPCIIGDRLFERLDLMKITPTNILDIGSSTGTYTRALQKKYTKAKVYGLDIALNMSSYAQSKKGWFSKERYICSDVEHLPFADDSIDFVFSNLLFYWLNTPDIALMEINRVLKPGGLLMFTSYGPDTLREMRSSSHRSSQSQHVRVNRFMDMHDLGDALTKTGFSGIVMDSESITMTYDSLDELHTDLRGRGETNLNAGRTKGLMGKSTWNNYIRAYEQYRNSEKLLPTSWEIVYGHGWAGTPQVPKVPHYQSEIGIKNL